MNGHLQRTENDFTSSWIPLTGLTHNIGWRSVVRGRKHFFFQFSPKQLYEWNIYSMLVIILTNRFSFEQWFWSKNEQFYRSWKFLPTWKYQTLLMMLRVIFRIWCYFQPFEVFLIIYPHLILLWNEALSSSTSRASRVIISVRFVEIKCLVPNGTIYFIRWHIN